MNAFASRRVAVVNIASWADAGGQDRNRDHRAVPIEAAVLLIGVGGNGGQRRAAGLNISEYRLVGGDREALNLLLLSR